MRCGGGPALLVLPPGVGIPDVLLLGEVDRLVLLSLPVVPVEGLVREDTPVKQGKYN